MIDFGITDSSIEGFIPQSVCARAALEVWVDRDHEFSALVALGAYHDEVMALDAKVDLGRALEVHGQQSSLLIDDHRSHLESASSGERHYA